MRDANVATDSLCRRIFLPVLLCFFLSGAAGLIYQVAWGKALGLVFGHTVYAVATVIAVFMGGLAVGSAFLGRWSERRENPVALYGWIEITIAAAGAFSLVGLAGVRELYLATYHAVAGSTAALVALRFFASALVLFVPTFLMGGTLPILVRGLTRTSSELGARVSRLYWVNTAGAVAGTLAAGFLLLPALGLRRTVACAVAMNIAAGLVALSIGRGVRVPVVPPQEDRPAEAAPAPWFLLVTFGVVGATAIAYEVAWTRLLATQVGSSTYAFTLMLATFLAGIVMGSALFERFVAGGREVTSATFALTQTLTGLAALAFLVFFQKLPLVVPPILQATNESFGGLVLAQFVTSALAMLPAAIVFGFNFPVVTVLIAGPAEASRRYAAAVGRAYAANTLGAILGATATGFWLVPLLGSFRVVAYAAAVNLLVAVLLLLRRRPTPRLKLAFNSLLLGAVAAAGWFNTFYDVQLASFNTVLYWDHYESNLTVPEAAGTVDIVFREDGLNSTITVAQTEDYISLRTNGKVDASDNDLLTQLLLGHLGAVFHPSPRRVLVIGFGSGMTVSALAAYPDVERIDCVEIEPAVIHAAPHLESLNRGVLRDPRVRIYLDDGRNFLLTSREQYDLIISEPSNPWIAGVATLFTDEFYGEVRARLKPGGILVQWVQGYAIFPADVRMVLATLVPHFPRVSLWRGEEQDLLLVAQTETAPLSLARLRRFWEHEPVRRDFEMVGLRHPEGILAFYHLDDADVRRMVAGAPRNTDDHTRLEYRAPRALLARGVGDQTLEMITAARSALVPTGVEAVDGPAFLLGAAETFIHLEEFSSAAPYISEFPAETNSPPAEIARARWLLARARFEEARAAYQRALQLDPSSLDAAMGLAETAKRVAEYDRAELLLRQVLARAPRHAAALDLLALIARYRDDWLSAVEWQRRRIEADPRASGADYARLGEFLLRAGEHASAAEALGQALRRDPYNFIAHRTVAHLHRLAGNAEKALEHLEFAARYHPSTDSGTYVALADVYESLGRSADATATLRKGRRIFPGDTQIEGRLAK
jgi:spermidine synthase